MAAFVASCAGAPHRAGSAPDPRPRQLAGPRRPLGLRQPLGPRPRPHQLAGPRRGRNRSRLHRTPGCRRQHLPARRSPGQRRSSCSTSGPPSASRARRSSPRAIYAANKARGFIVVAAGHGRTGVGGRGTRVRQTLPGGLPRGARRGLARGEPVQSQEVDAVQRPRLAAFSARPPCAEDTARETRSSSRLT